MVCVCATTATRSGHRSARGPDRRAQVVTRARRTALFRPATCKFIDVGTSLVSLSNKHVYTWIRGRVQGPGGRRPRPQHIGPWPRGCRRGRCGGRLVSDRSGRRAVPTRWPNRAGPKIRGSRRGGRGRRMPSGRLRWPVDSDPRPPRTGGDPTPPRRGGNGRRPSPVERPGQPGSNGSLQPAHSCHEVRPPGRD